MALAIKIVILVTVCAIVCKVGPKVWRSFMEHLERQRQDRDGMNPEMACGSLFVLVYGFVHSICLFQREIYNMTEEERLELKKKLEEEEEAEKAKKATEESQALTAILIKDICTKAKNGGPKVHLRSETA